LRSRERRDSLVIATSWVTSRDVSLDLWRYPELTRRGIRIAWLSWAVLLGVAVSPIDPIASWWDEVALVAGGLVAIWPRLFGESPAER
jgi:hypothetical protein